MYSFPHSLNIEMQLGWAFSNRISCIAFSSVFLVMKTELFHKITFDASHNMYKQHGITEMHSIRDD